MKTVLFLTLLTLGASAGNEPGIDEPGEAAQEPNVLERYDLRPVLPRVDQSSGWAGLLTQLPPEWFNNVRGLRVHDLEESAAPDVILELLTQILGDALNVKGSQIALESDSRLLVLAPASVQSMVAEVLGVLESVFSASVAIRVDVVSSPEALGPEFLGRNVVSVAEADRMVEALEARGATHREHVFQLSSGRTSTIDQSSSVPVVLDYDVEIAQGSFIWDPIVLDVMDGMRLFVRGVPKPTGTLVSAMIVQGELLGGVQDRPLDLTGALAREETGGVDFVAGPQAVQTVQLLNHSFVFTSFLSEGEAIVVASQTKLGGAGASQLVVMRQLGKPAPAFVTTRVAGTSRTLALVNTELFRSPEFQVTSRPSVGDMHGHPVVSATLSTEYSSFLYDWLRYRYSVWRAIGPWAVVVTDPAWDAKGVDVLEELVRGADVTDELVEVQVDMVATEDGAEPPVRWSLPVVAGTTCGAVLGVSGTVVRDYDVEVAQYSAVPDPFVDATFNGLALSLEVSKGRAAAAEGTAWILDLKGTGQYFRGPVSSFDPDGPVNARIDRPEYDVLNFAERVTVPGAQGKAGRVRVGPEVRRAGRGGLSLVVGVRH